MMILVAIGQLTPWGFKMMNDGKRSKEDEEENPQWSHFCLGWGIFATVLLSGAGWTGVTAIIVELMSVSKPNVSGIWTIHVVLVLTIIIMIGAGRQRPWKVGIMMILYTIFTIHIVGTHIILALVSDNWKGIPNGIIESISSIIFFVGKRLLFLDFPRISCCG